MKKSFVFFVSCLLTLLCRASYAEDVKITTYYPSPYGSYKQLQVQNGDEDADITKFTQGLLQAGLSIITDYTDTAYTPGLFWSTQNDNSTKPKAGIWMYEASTGSKLLFDTSNDYTVGLNSTPGMTIDQNGHVGIGTLTPNSNAGFEVAGSKPILIPRVGSAPADSDSTNGMLIYNTGTNKFQVFQNDGWTDMVAAGGGAPVCNVVDTGLVPIAWFPISLMSSGRNICEDSNGCSITVYYYTSSGIVSNSLLHGKLVQKNFSGTSKWQFIYTVNDSSDGGVNFFGTVSSSTGVQASVQTALFTWNSSQCLYDDHPSAPIENDSSTLSLYDGYNARGTVVSVCD